MMAIRRHMLTCPRVSQGRGSMAAGHILALIFVCILHSAPAKRGTGSNSRRPVGICRGAQTYSEAVHSAGEFSRDGRHKEEAECWELASELNASASLPHVALCKLAQNSRQLDIALEHAESAVAVDPTSAAAWAEKGNVLYSIGRYLDAAEMLEKALTLSGGTSMQDWNSLALAYSAAKWHGKAERAYKEALRLRTNAHDMRGIGVMLNLGNLLADMKRFAEARSVYTVMLQRKPDYAVGQYSLGRAYDKEQKFSSAIVHYKKAIDLEPNLAQAHMNLGVAYLNMGQPADAVEPLGVGVRLKPTPDGFNNYGDALGDVGRYLDAVNAYEEALDLSVTPSGYRYFPKAYYSMLHYNIHLCSWDRLEAACRDLAPTLMRELSEGQETQMTPIESLVLIGTYTDHALLRQVTHNFALRSLHRIATGPPNEARFTTYRSLKKDEKRVRLGYISGGLRLHPDGKNLQGVFGVHDRSKVEVHCFSLLRDEGSDVQRRIMETCEFYHDYTDMSNYEAARGVNQAGINVLLDVNGYTGEGVRQQRNIILAFSPAPVQVNFLAWVCSSGAPFIQYLISDRIASPPEFEADYSEKLLVMPNSYFPSDLRNSGGDVPKLSPKAMQAERSRRGLPASGPLLSGFNQLWKVDKRLFNAWLQIANRTQTSNAMLWLPLFPDVAKPSLESIAASHRLDHRIVWTPLYSQDEHLRVKALASLQLDTYVYNGHTSGADILWAGVPTLTLPGIKQSARVGASLLQGLGLHTYLVARSLQDYADIAVAAVRGMRKKDAGWLAATRQLLAKSKADGPLFDVRLWAQVCVCVCVCVWFIGLTRRVTCLRGAEVKLLIDLIAPN